MRVLLLDIAYDGYTLGFGVDGCVTNCQHFTFGAGTLNHIMTTQLISQIQSVVCQGIESSQEDTRPPLHSITHIVTTVGPASFTALRSALSALQGIAFALKCPVFALSRLEAIALGSLYQSYDAEQPVDVYLDNTKQAFFHGRFAWAKGGELLTLAEPHVVAESSVATHFCITHPPEPTQLLSAMLRYASHPTVSWGGGERLQPFYGHTPSFQKRRSIL